MAKNNDAQSQYYNAQAASLAAQVANQAAQLAFQRERFEKLELPQFQTMSSLEKEKLAFAKATETWNQAFKEASLSGSYQGVPAAEYLLSAAQLTGQFYQPGTLTPTQQARYQAVQNSIDYLQKSMQDHAPGSAEYGQMAQDLATHRTEMAGLQQILQGTDKAPVQTLQAQNQQFQQMMALAGLTGMVPGTTGPGGTGGTGTGGAGAVAGGAGGTAGGAPTMAYLQMLAELTGQYNGAPTLAAQQFAQQFGLSEGELTGYYDGQSTLSRQTMENSQANQLLQLAASLRGPRNAFQYAKVIGGTPGGLQDVLGAMAGRYNLPSFAGGTANPEAVNLHNFVGDVQAQAMGQPLPSYPPTSGPPNEVSPIGSQPRTTLPVPPTFVTQPPPSGAPASGSMNEVSPGSWPRQPSAPSVSPTFVRDGGLPSYTPTSGGWSQPTPSYQANPPGVQAPTNAWNYQPTGDGSNMVYPPGISAPQQAGQITSQTPLGANQLSQIGAQALATQPYALPAPSTWNAENFNQLGDYRQQLMLGAYEAAGHDADSVLDQFKASLPDYSGPKAGKIAGL